MNPLRRAATIVVTMLCLAAMTPGRAHAQAAKKGEPPPEEQKGYTLPYFFTIAGVLVTIIAVCRPAGRKWDIEADDEVDAD